MARRQRVTMRKPMIPSRSIQQVLHTLSLSLSTFPSFFPSFFSTSSSLSVKDLSTLQSKEHIEKGAESSKRIVHNRFSVYMTAIVVNDGGRIVDGARFCCCNIHIAAVEVALRPGALMPHSLIDNSRRKELHLSTHS